jgi:PAS domain S-box-containing protein
MLSVWVGLWSGGLLGAALLLELFATQRNRWLTVGLVAALLSATLLVFVPSTTAPGGALIASLATLALVPLMLEIGFTDERLSRARESGAASAEARFQSDAHARAVIDNAVDAIAVIDANGIILSFNRAAYRMFGYEPREVIGSNVSMLMPEPYHTQHDACLQRYLDTGEPRIIGIGRELVARRKDGTTLPIHLSVSEVVIHGQRTFPGVMRDISIERADKEEIRRQNERLSVTVRNAPMGIVTYRFGENFAFTNRAFETTIGYSNAELAKMAFAISRTPTTARN